MCQSLEECCFHIWCISLLIFNVFHYCPGPVRSVEKDKLEHVTHLTNLSKLFELRVGKFAL